MTMEANLIRITPTAAAPVLSARLAKGRAISTVQCRPCIERPPIEGLQTAASLLLEANLTKLGMRDPCNDSISKAFDFADCPDGGLRMLRVCKASK